MQDADYRVASQQEDRDAIFQLRYEAYRRENAIAENARRRFTDDYDQMDNCWLFGIHLDDRLVSSIRFHVISPDAPKGPAYDVFPDIVRPMIRAGQTIVDPTRLVVDRAMTELYPELPYVTIRAAFMAAEYFEAEYMLATVRREHQAFYKRFFGFETIVRATAISNPAEADQPAGCEHAAPARHGCRASIRSSCHLLRNGGCCSSKHALMTIFWKHWFHTL